MTVLGLVLSEGLVLNLAFCSDLHTYVRAVNGNSVLHDYNLHVITYSFFGKVWRPAEAAAMRRLRARVVTPGPWHGFTGSPMLGGGRRVFG